MSTLMRSLLDAERQRQCQSHEMAHGITRTGICKARREHRIAANEDDHRTDEVARKIIDLRRGWMAVGQAWQDCHEACETCEWNTVDGEAPDWDGDCTLGQLGEQPHQCPALRADAAVRDELQAMADLIKARAPLQPPTPHAPAWQPPAPTPAPTLAQYVAALRCHDWHYQRADDNASYRKGEAERAALRAMQKRIDPDALVWKLHSKEAA